MALIDITNTTIAPLQQNTRPHSGRVFVILESVFLEKLIEQKDHTDDKTHHDGNTEHTLGEVRQIVDKFHRLELDGGANQMHHSYDLLNRRN